MLSLVPADAVGNGFTETMTVSVLRQLLLSVPVTVYVVPAIGVAHGDEIVGSSNVAAGFQEYVAAPVADN